jgi:hypothetical protein
VALDYVTRVKVDEIWTSGASGNFMMGTDLPAGSYLVKAEAVGYYSEYYRDVTAPNSATPVVATAGLTTPGINFTLNDEALHISAVSATSTGGTMATITWTTDQPADSQVEYGLTTGYGSSTTLDSSLTTSHSVDLPGLTSQTTYHYRVRGADGEVPANEASSGDYTFTTPDITAPGISNVNATNITGTSSTVSWTTDETASSQVEYGLTTSYDSSTTLDSSLATTHSVNLTGLTSQTTYHYRAISFDDSGNSTYSGDYTFTTADITAPGISNVNATKITGTSATVSWTTDETASSQVEYGLTATYGSRTAWDSKRVNDHSVDLAGLASGSTYHYRVISIDAANNRAVSEDYTFNASARIGGMPVWAWVLIALAAVAVAGAAAYLIRRRLAEQHQP